jgi:hypothetical protein
MSNELVLLGLLMLFVVGFAVLSIQYLRLKSGLESLKEEIKTEALKNGCGDNVYDMFIQGTRKLLNKPLGYK